MPINFPTEKRIYLFFLSLICFVILVWAVAPPKDFPQGAIVNIPEGSGLFTLSLQLKEERVVRSAFWFRIAAITLGGERDMKAGQYYFSEPENPFGIAWRVYHGKYNIETHKVTIPEGFTVVKISALFDEEFPFFDNPLFEASAPEGYLFPDTYFIPVTATATSTIKLLHDNFIRKTFPLTPDVEKSNHNLEDIMVMASLIEGEANNQKDREMVSDVLWKRLKIGMALQVDVDKKTYEFQGLPSRPINNPGLDAIKAAIYPTSTPYLYYLTGDDGLMHYAKTFEEHKTNIEKYLSN
jgi:UPF0755 protein